MGTFGADLDGFGSQFGMGVILAGGGAPNGHLTCLLAGRSAILGLRLIVVQGGVTPDVAHADASITFRGVATVNLGNGQQFRWVPSVVTVTAGGPGGGTLH